MIFCKSALRVRYILSGAAFFFAMLASTLFAQTPANPSQAAPLPPSPHVIQHHSSSPYRPTSLTPHARNSYQNLWGIDSLEVKAVESGKMIRFSYLVLDPLKAAQLNDKKATPYLIDEQAGVRLEVPIMEKVGQLRQTANPEAGREYWMLFSNKERAAKPGDRVRVMIGKFQAEGLYVR